MVVSSDSVFPTPIQGHVYTPVSKPEWIPQGKNSSILVFYSYYLLFSFWKRNEMKALGLISSITQTMHGGSCLLFQHWGLEAGGSEVRLVLTRSWVQNQPELHETIHHKKKYQKFQTSELLTNIYTKTLPPTHPFCMPNWRWRMKEVKV